MKNSIFDPTTGQLNGVTEEEHKSTVDYILQDVMKNKKPTKIQKEFILLG